GSGIVHCEMFPLLRKDKPNPLELFQIWLNLPKADKLVAPHFAMLWSGDIPRVTLTDNKGRTTEVTVIAGPFEGARPPAPPPHYWASRPDTDVAIWTIRMVPRAIATLPPASHPGATRTVYFFRGSTLKVGEEVQRGHSAIVVENSRPLYLEAGDEPVDIL